MSFSKILLFLGVTLTILLTGYGFKTHIFSLNFVDEDDNIVIGGLLSNSNKLYKDIFTQHQPSAYIMSNIIQKITRPQNIYMVVKRHREFMIAWSAIWLIFLSWRFGWRLWLVGSILEMSKIILLGNMFLAESLVLYPLIYLIAYMLEKGRDKWPQEMFLVITTYWFVWFTLSPLWPFLVFYFFWGLFTTHHPKQYFRNYCLVGVVAAACLISTADLGKYLYDVIYINYKYYLPLTTQIGFSESLLKAFASPILPIFSSGHSPLLGLIKLFSVILLSTISYSIYKKKLSSAILYIMILALVSLRYINPNNTIYGGFHMLPWYGVMTYLSIHTLTELKLRLLARIGVFVVFVVFILGLLFPLVKNNLLDSRDKERDYYIHYSPGEDIWSLVKILSRKEPLSVWVEPVEYWPYWQSGAKPYSTMVNYYGWMDKSEPLKHMLRISLDQDLPVIIWNDNGEGIKEYLDNYLRFKRDGKYINLYLRKDRLDLLTDDVRRDLSYYRFEIN